MLAIYIHWPFCKSKCPYCDFNSHVRENVEQGRWRDALLKELDYMKSHVPGRTVSSIFFGGGTPSLMPAETVAALIGRVHALWPVSGDIEITLEANPTSVEAKTFTDFRKAGVNRLSLGVQSLNPDALKFLGREHSVVEALKAIASARTHFDRISFDLIYARPGQTPMAWEAELKEALRHAGGHLSLYQLTIEENTAFHHAYKKRQFTLPDDAAAEMLYRLTEDVMQAHGLLSYEVSNYAKPGQESRHNLAYWKGQDYIGIGPGAHGRFCHPARREAAAQDLTRSCAPSFGRPQDDGRIATQTLKSPERWLEGVERDGHAVEVWQPIERRQEIEERVMMGLRLAEGIDYAHFKTQVGCNLEDHIDRRKRDFFITQGLLADNASALQATLKGRLLLNTLTAELLA